ncbi:site-specific DNA-methyltransferase [Jannaschia sp. Os4]|uniref:site-specific DNA-methyltransferase n=1 Tax=Jannaschia sp. Os4 TaxID=2807617 RepID=UPI00193AD6AC|nr:site-specific DNA-methyltransferase [Jannaschia sp. Os4]MBM2576389.1 site-specific DNA-methyltransferase [Jannaschia sp. Os4]
MTELNFKGKEFVYNHHLSVPFRPLEPQAEKGIGPVDLDGNLIVQGDNLHALKALLPRYAGKVDCIFIDPPYNTGNEGWAYNDNVNAPMIREWLEANPIGIEDGLRHDRWCAMMWPRLRLLHELLSEGGSIWITIDDHELHRLKLIMDEIFGHDAFVEQVSWQKRYTRSNNTNDFTSVVDYIVIYQKSPDFQVNLTRRDDTTDGRYGNPDNDHRGPWKATPFLNQVSPEKRPNLCYPITNPHTGETTNPTKKAWRNDQETYNRLLAEDRFWWGADRRKPIPDIKSFLNEVKDGMAPINLWSHEFAGNTDAANNEIKAIFGEKVFDTPKPVKLIERVLEHAISHDGIVLDSFAGSGTTAHAVLEANKRDSGNRRFILVEMEDYADRLTAERVRRVIEGYDFTGTQRTELLREKLTWTKLKKADKLTDAVEKIENLHGHEYDAVKKTVKDGELIVTGEKKVEERAEGLGGTFTYCTLGEPVDLNAVLEGTDLPAWDALGGVLFHMATARAFDASTAREADGYLGEADGRHVWLIYKPDLDWLKSPEAALTLARSRGFAETAPDARHLVFAPARFVSQAMLDAEGLPVEFAPLPFALYRIER